MFQGPGNFQGPELLAAPGIFQAPWKIPGGSLSPVRHAVSNCTIYGFDTISRDYREDTSQAADYHENLDPRVSRGDTN